MIPFLVLETAFLKNSNSKFTHSGLILGYFLCIIMEVAIPLVFLLENSFSGENNRNDFEIRFSIKTPGRVKFVARLKK